MVPNQDHSDPWGDKVYKREESVVTREIIGETILVPIRGNLADMQRIFTLNEVGAYIWEKLDGKTKLDEIHKGLEETFEVENKRAKHDLDEFITDLLEAELIMGDY